MKRGKRKYGQVPQKFLGKRKVEIPFGYFIGDHCVCACICVCTCVCVCMCVCMHVCTCVCAHVYVHVRVHVYVHVRVYVFVTADNVCDIHITLSYFQSVCNAN